MKRRNLEFIITVILYLATAFLSSLIAYLILRDTPKITAAVRQANVFWKLIFPVMVAEACALVFTLLNGRYTFRKVPLYGYIVQSFMETVVTAGIWALILLGDKSSVASSRWYLCLTILLHFVILAFGLWAVQSYSISRYYKSNLATIVGIATTRDRAENVIRMLHRDWSRKTAALALLDEKVPEYDFDALNAGKLDTSGIETILHVPVLADSDTFVEWARKSAVDEIFIVADDNDRPEVIRNVKALTQMGIPVYMSILSVARIQKYLAEEKDEGGYTPRVDHRLTYLYNLDGQKDKDIPLAAFEPPRMLLRWTVAKRALDIVGGVVGSALTLIMAIPIGIAIKRESPGPVFFAQTRVGKNGRKFKMYKFRSMVQDAEQQKASLMKQNEMNGLMFKMKDDPRITKVGRFLRKTSLDEFPQFFNVLKGDMSLVGTRPPTVGEFEKYSNYHKRRLSMKPGITGLWQVSGRSDITDFEEVVRMDCSYIDNWSFGKDIKILWKTIVAVISQKGSE
ncbi:MAG: sugar transferase [Lachnospiraceae bacterium]|jgi:exopolysaccharide biosynthesis polyprenyl glycosylphosphotransferase